MDKLQRISNTWQMAEDQIRNAEHFILQSPFDQVDQEYVSQFASLRKSMADLRVRYEEAKATSVIRSEPTPSPSSLRAQPEGSGEGKGMSHQKANGQTIPDSSPEAQNDEWEGSENRLYENGTAIDTYSAGKRGIE